eukprot:Skav236282  [mRNA]  locus=scaffold2529:3242:6218:+ [translate_table: standard]
MTLTESTSDVLSVAWSTAFLAAGDRSGKDWVMTKTLEDASGDICALAWSGQLLATGGEDQKVRIYNCAQDSAARSPADTDFALSATLQDASDYIRCVAWAGQLLAAAGDDKKVRIYDQDLLWSGAREQEIASLNLKYDTMRIPEASAAASFDRVVEAVSKLRAVLGAECSLLHTLSEASNWVFSIAWSPELQLLAAGSKDNKVRVYDATQDFEAPRAGIRRMGQSEDVENNMQDFGLVKALKEASNGIEAVAFLGRLIAAGGKDWKDFQLVQTLDQASDWIRAIARHGNHFATGADDKKIRIYRVLEDCSVRSWQRGDF